jgi:hypothetical protein
MKVLITKKGERFRTGPMEKYSRLSNGEVRAFKANGCLEVSAEVGAFLIAKGFGRNAEPIKPVVVAPPPAAVMTQVIDESAIIADDMQTDETEPIQEALPVSGRSNQKGKGK